GPPGSAGRAAPRAARFLTMGAGLSLLLLPFGPFQGTEGFLESVERDLIRVVERVRPCVATVEVDRASPLQPLSLSGFLLHPDAEGTVVTTGPALEGAQRISVRFADGRSVIGALLGRGPDGGVGFVRVPAEGLPVPPLSDGAGLRPGSIVIGLGSPYGFPS